MSTKQGTQRLDAAINKKKQRCKNIENDLRKFNVLYLNIRGLRGILSFSDIINSMKPAIFCLVEIYLSERDKISFEGYQCFSLNRASEG